MKRTELTVDEIVAAHPVKESQRHRWSFSVDLSCACGWTDRAPHKFKQWYIADHWAAVGGIPKFRSVADIHAGRGYGRFVQQTWGNSRDDALSQAKTIMEQLIARRHQQALPSVVRLDPPEEIARVK